MKVTSSRRGHSSPSRHKLKQFKGNDNYAKVSLRALWLYLRSRRRRSRFWYCTRHSIWRHSRWLVLPHLWRNEGRLRALRRLKITSAGGIIIAFPNLLSQVGECPFKARCSRKTRWSRSSRWTRSTRITRTSRTSRKTRSTSLSNDKLFYPEPRLPWRAKKGLRPSNV